MSPGSLLKRTFTATMDESHGFSYFKKRKFSGQAPLSQITTPATPLFGKPGGALFSPSPPTRDEAALHQPDAAVHPIKHISVSATSTSPSELHATIPKIQESVPTVPSSPTGSVHGNDHSGSSAESQSFSSLINYDPSSQSTCAPSTQQQVPPQEPTPLLKGPSNAELLRLRLRVAMYKVDTGQTHVPFDDLKVDEKLVRTSQIAAAIAALPAQPHKSPPASILHSSRRNCSIAQNNSTPGGLEDLSAHGRFRGMGMATPARKAGNSPNATELTSSIVKGQVAEGLLGLRDAV